MSQDPDGVDKWVYLGTYNLPIGAKVELDSIISGADGSTDVAYDAMAFQSEPSDPTASHGCGVDYP